MDLETKKVTISCDAVFDEVSLYKFDANEGKGTTNLALFPDDSASYNRRNIFSSEENIQLEEVIEVVT